MDSLSFISFVLFPLGIILPIIFPALPARLPPLLILRPMVVCEGRIVSLANLLGVECTPPVIPQFSLKPFQDRCVLRHIALSAWIVGHHPSAKCDANGVAASVLAPCTPSCDCRAGCANTPHKLCSWLANFAKVFNCSKEGLRV